MPDATPETRLRQVTAEHLGLTDDFGKIGPESSFLEDLGADSIDVIELAMAVEDEFHIRISDDEVQAAITEGTFGDLLALVERLAKREGV